MTLNKSTGVFDNAYNAIEDSEDVVLRDAIEYRILRSVLAKILYDDKYDDSCKVNMVIGATFKDIRKQVEAEVKAELAD